jgi:hypothetical protein
MQSLILYTLRPEGFMAQTFAQFLSTDKCVVVCRSLSQMPAPMGLEARQRLTLKQEQKELRQAIGGLELGIALAAGAPHRFPEGPMWAEEKKTHERRLAVVEWKLAQLVKQNTT